MQRRHLMTAVSAVVLASIGFGSAEAQDKPVLAFVTNAAADFFGPSAAPA